MYQIITQHSYIDFYIYIISILHTNIYFTRTCVPILFLKNFKIFAVLEKHVFTV